MRFSNPLAVEACVSILLCTPCVPVTSVFAAEPDTPSTATTLDRVTVIGAPLTSTAPGLEAARAEAERVPGGASIVSREDYADGRASTLAEVFAFTPGVFAQNRFGAEEARLSIRGSGLQRTFHMRGIYLLQDGIPITLADGSGDFQAVEPLALSYTQVLRGANALEYGGTALGGSINFVSPSGYEGGGVRTRLEGGSFGYLRALASLGGVAGRGDYFASASAYTQQGFRDWSEQRNQRVFGNAGLRVRDNLETRFFASAVHTDSQLPGSLTKAQLRDNARQANAGSLAGRQKRDFDLYRLANRTVLDLDDRFIEATVGYTYKDLWHPIFQLLQQRSNDFYAGLRYVDEHELAGRSNRVVVGLSPSWNRVSDNRFANLAGSKGARTAQSRQQSHNYSVYAQNEFGLDEHWTLVGGAQWTDAGREYQDLFLGNGDQGLQAAYTQLSPKLGVLWRGGARWTVFGNVSGSFEPPSFGELTGGPGVSLLKAQTARTVEIGTRGATGRVQWDLAAYSARVRDELLGLNDPLGQPLGTVNAPRTRHRGLELGALVSLSHSLSWRSSYLWSDLRFDDNATYGERRLPGLPEHFYRGELVWTPAPDYALSLNTEWVPRRYAIDMANTGFADSHALVGLKLARDGKSGFSWFVEGRNLTDRAYAATTGVIADAGGLDAAQFLPGEARAFYAGIDWKPRGN